MRREQRNESLKVLVGFLDHGVLETLALIGAVAKNSELTDAEKVQRICALLTDNQVTQSLDPEQLAELKATLVSTRLINCMADRVPDSVVSFGPPRRWA